MSDVNKAIIVGRLGRDPELRYTQAGKPVANLSVATSSKRNGEESTEWHRVAVFGKTAENCNNYLSKGSQVYVEGKITTEKYEKDGITRYSTSILAWDVKFLGSKGEGGGQRKGSQQPSSYDGGNYNPQPVFDDDVPF